MMAPSQRHGQHLVTAACAAVKPGLGGEVPADHGMSAGKEEGNQRQQNSVSEAKEPLLRAAPVQVCYGRP